MWFYVINATVALGLLVFGALANAADLYVAPTGADTNAGTAAAPFKTINKASTLATPGTTVHVAAGSYPGFVRTKASGVAGSQVTYISEPRWGAKLTAASGWLWINDGSYVLIDGFDISGGGVGGILSRASNVQINHNHVHDLTATVCDSNGGAAIDAGDYFAVNTDMMGNLIHDIGWATKCGRVQGLYHSHKGGTIANNIVYRVAGWGIHLWHNPSYITISNNLSFNNGSGGIVVAAADGPNYGKVPADYITVTNNIVMDNPRGIYENGTTGPNNRYINNLLYRNGTNIAIRVNAVGTLTVAPMFVRYAADGGGDYHPQASSPAVNAGSPVGAPAVDYDNVSRPQGAVVDIGPLEFVVAAPPPPPPPPVPEPAPALDLVLATHLVDALRALLVDDSAAAKREIAAASQIVLILPYPQR